VTLTKRKALALILALLISAVAGASLVRFGKANWLFPTGQEPPDAPILSIALPVRNKTQTTSDVDLDFTVYVEGWNEYIHANLSWVGYSLDEKTDVTFVGSYGTPRAITDLRVSMFGSDTRATEFHFSGKLTGLTDGIHSIKVSALYVGNYSPAPYSVETFSVIGCSQKIFFSIDTQPPEISILSPEPRTYNVTNISLNITFSEPVSWVRYSLDGKGNVTLDMNNTLSFNHSLTELSEGKHNLTFYACDRFGHTGASDNIEFMVVQETETGSDPTGFSAVILLAASPVFVAVVVAAGLLVYSKKRRGGQTA
jgi:hypothetical protein